MELYNDLKKKDWLCKVFVLRKFLEFISVYKWLLLFDTMNYIMTKKKADFRNKQPHEGWQTEKNKQSPPPREGYDAMSNSKRSKVALNPEFSFSKTGCLIKA